MRALPRSADGTVRVITTTDEDAKPAHLAWGVVQIGHHVGVEATLGQVLALPRLGLRRVAGVADPHRPVRWVAVSELTDPTPYLEGGELLLTTGMNLPHDGSDELAAYVERLTARGVVALGLAVGLTHAEIPAGLVRAADEHGLALLEVPLPTPFIAITRAVADLVAQAERDSVRRSLEIHRRLTRSAAKPDAVTAVLRELARLLGGWTVVADPAGSPLHSSSPAAQRHVSLVAEEVRRLRMRGLRGTSSVPLGDDTVEIYPLGVTGRPRRYLAVCVPGGSDSVARAAVAAAVSLLSLAVERSGPAAGLVGRLRREAARLVLSGEVGTADRLLAAAGADPVPEQVAVVVASAAHADDVLREIDEDDGVRVLATVAEGRVVAVTAAEDAASLADALVAHGARVGVSRPTGREAVAAAADEARRALLSAQPGQDVVHADAVLRSGVGALVDPEAARRWARARLAPLRAYEEAGTVDLVGSLRTFLEHHGQWHPAAAQLGIHRHTLRYRMRRVEKLLDVSLDSPQVRMDLWFAVQQGG